MKKKNTDVQSDWQGRNSVSVFSSVYKGERGGNHNRVQGKDLSKVGQNMFLNLMADKDLALCLLERS